MTPFRSIRGRLQIWYGLILVLVLAGFGITAYHVERGRAMRSVDEELHRRADTLATWLRGPPRGPGPDQMPPRGPGPDQMPFDRPPPGRMPPRQMQPQRPPGMPMEDGDRGEFPPRQPGEFHLPPRVLDLFAEIDTNGFYYVIFALDGTGTELARSTNAPAGVPVFPPPRMGPPPFRMGNPPPDPDGRPPSQQPQRMGRPIREMSAKPPPPRMRGTFREVAIMARQGEAVLVGRSIAKDLADLRQVAWILASVGGTILLFGLVGGWWLAGRAIRPIEDISAAAVKIAGGDLSQRVSVSDTENELGRLANVLNSTFSRLEAAFAQQQQFTSDAAHELRTPISVMLTQTQAALNRERSSAEYRETVESCERAAQRMRRLIESLLELARLEAGQEMMKRAPFDLARVAADCVELMQPLATARRITVLANLPATQCQGDSERIAQVITNLLTNAVHYNQEGGEVRIATTSENDFAVLTVADSGPGIAAEHLPHVFERFYRADPARTTSQGRAGLGLAISKAIVDAHGGSIEVSSQPPAGSTFTLRLPAG